MSTSGYESYTVCFFFLLDDVTRCHISNAFMTSLILIKGSSHETLAVLLVCFSCKLMCLFQV